MDTVSCRRLTLYVISLIVLLLFPACVPDYGPVEITAEELEEHVRYLAGDKLAGREPGTSGITLAEMYIVNRFREAGLVPPPGESDYFLDFPVYEYGLDKQATRLTLLKGEFILRCEIERDYVPLTMSASGFALGEIVYAGYGITAPEHSWDDYQGLDVRNKIALIFRHEPRHFAAFITNPKQSYTRHSYYKVKIENAAAHGAKAVLFVTDPYYNNPHEKQPRISSRLHLDANAAPSDFFHRGSEFEESPLPACLLAWFPGNWLLYTSGYSPAALQHALDAGIKPRDRPLKGMKGLFSVRHLSPPRRHMACNTAAFLPGRDQVRKDEWVVIGAHHDHLGSFKGRGDTIYNGADDNASGVSGVLELAEYLAGQKEKPKRSLLFMTFSAEEAGLLGSDALFSQHLLSADKFTYMCNLDMIGRNPSSILEVYVRNPMTDPVPAAREFLSRLSPPTAFVDADIQKALSDDYEFARRGIHSFFFFSGLHQDYHTVDDESNRLDYQVMKSRVRLIGEFILFLANR